MSNRGRRKLKKKITKNFLLKKFNAKDPERFKKLTVPELTKILKEQIRQGNKPDFHPFEENRYSNRWDGGVTWTDYNKLDKICLKIIDYNSKPW